jgi:hypothetical protein
VTVHKSDSHISTRFALITNATKIFAKPASTLSLGSNIIVSIADHLKVVSAQIEARILMSKRRRKTIRVSFQTFFKL